MRKPILKQEGDLTPADFKRHPAWVSVHNFDSDEPWYEQSDEETFRPWTGPLPFREARGFVLFAATFRLADGSLFAGYCRSVRDDWDAPIAPLPRSNGGRGEARSWSDSHAGSPLSVLLLQSPTIFIGERAFDFHLRTPDLRGAAVRNFYAAIGKTPREVFPVAFAAKRSGLAEGVTSGRLDGLYDFPMGNQMFEIGTGEALLRDDGLSPAAIEAEAPPESSAPSVAPIGEPPEPDFEKSFTLSPEDFSRHSVWVRIPLADDTKPWHSQHAFIPWAGPLPADPEGRDVRILATFTLPDGSRFNGHVRPAPENWADIVPPPTMIGAMALQGVSPKVQWGDTPLALIEQHQPFIFVRKKTFRFWCGIKDPFEIRDSFYRAVKKRPDDIFPIRYESVPGLSSWLVSGELNGFCVPTYVRGKPPWLIR